MPGAASRRMARLRDRQRRGEVAPVTVSTGVVAMLLDTQWLLPAESEDRNAIGRAVARMLEAIAAEHTEPESVTRLHTAARLRARSTHEQDHSDSPTRPRRAEAPQFGTRRPL